MKKKIKTLIILAIILGMFANTGCEAFCLSFNLFKKNDSQKVEQTKADKAAQKAAQKNAQKAQKEQDKQNKETVKAKKAERKKNAKAVKKAKPKKEKYDDSLVKAKTDKNQPAVRIIVKDDKKEKKPKKQKEPKIKQGRFRKPKESEASKQTPKVHEVNLTPENKKQEEKAHEDVFSPDNKTTMEAAVSTNRIISVDDCVRIALENNPTILSQLLSKDIYKNRIAQAWSNYFPKLNAALSYSNNNMLVTNFRFPMQEYNQWNMPNVGFNQLIYDFGKTGAQAGAAKKTYEASRETLQASINDVVYQVKSAYYNQLYLQQQVEVYEYSVLQYQIHLKQAQAYYAIGSKAKIDVSTAAYNLDNTKLTLIQAKNAVENGFATLTNAMGVPEFAPFDIKDRLDKKRYDITFDEAFKIATEQSPTLAAAKKKMEGSKLLVKQAKVAFLPDLSGFGNYVSGGKTPDNDYGYQIGAQLSYSNLNLLLLKQQVDEATLTYKKDQADYETQRQNLYLNVKQAYIQLKNAQQSIPVARASMEVAKERYDIASGRYKAGLGDAIELKDSQIEYVNARLQYYNTLTQYHISAANLERVIGAPLTASDVNL